MLKKVLLMAAVVLLGLPGLAHAQLGRGEISVGYGVAPVTDWIDAYSDKLLDVLDMKDASMDSWGGVSVNYTFRIVDERAGYLLKIIFVLSYNPDSDSYVEKSASDGGRCVARPARSGSCPVGAR